MVKELVLWRRRVQHNWKVRDHVPSTEHHETPHSSRRGYVAQLASTLTMRGASVLQYMPIGSYWPGPSLSVRLSVCSSLSVCPSVSTNQVPLFVATHQGGRMCGRWGRRERRRGL